MINKCRIIPNAKDINGNVINTHDMFHVKDNKGSYYVITNGYATIVIHQRYLTLIETKEIKAK